MNIEEIINALKLIKRTCNDAGDCDECVLGTADGFCKVDEQSPANWEIDDRCVVRLMM